MAKDVNKLAVADVAYVERFGLKGFVEISWSQFEPSRFLDNWHIDEICLHLEALHSGDIRNLIINIPPSCMKSLLASVMFPLWVWTQTPDFRFLYASFDHSVSKRDARKARNVIESVWWKERWPHVSIVPDNGSVEDYTNNHTGFRLSTTPRGKATGRHVDLVAVDDPHKPMDLARGNADEAKESANVWEWWTGTIPTRAREPKTFRKLVIMQRLAENDLVGRIEDAHAEKFEVLKLPMEFDDRKPCATVLRDILGAPYGGDRRTEHGELLWPERFPADTVEGLKASLRAIGGERNVAGQLQQEPAADSGNRFQREWIRRWGVEGSKYQTLPHVMEMNLEISVDAAFKEGLATDFVVMQVWAFVKRDALLLDQVRGRWSFVKSVDELRALCKKWPRAWVKKIENKANGPAIANVLESEIPGIQLVEPEGGKEARASAVEPVWRAGCVYIPPDTHTNDAGEAWVPGFVRELLAFPGAKHDDQVDACTQALLEFASGVSASLYADFAKAAAGVIWG